MPLPNHPITHSPNHLEMVSETGKNRVRTRCQRPGTQEEP